MAWNPVANAEATPGAGGGSTGAIDTTGADILFAHVASFAGSASVSDSKGNTWVPLTERAGTSRFSQIFYVVNPTVGSGHTFTVAGTNLFCHFAVAAFSGADTTAPFDQQNGATADSVGSIATGSVTPTEDGELIVAGVVAGDTEPTINSSFTISDAQAFAGGSNMSGGLAYLAQGTAAAVNPTWSWTSTTDNAAASIATFKGAGGGGGGGNRRRRLIMGAA